MRLNYYILLLLGFTLLFNSIGAQSRYSAEVNLYTTEQGLPSNHVYQCFQDRRGLLWLLTENGLCRFDGRNFQLVLNKGFNPDFSKNIIRFEDADHDLWISIHAANGPTRYTLFNTLTNQVRTPEEKFGPSCPDDIRDIELGKNESYWITDGKGNLFQYRAGQKLKPKYQLQDTTFGIYFVDTTRNLTWLELHGDTKGLYTVCRLINAQGKAVATHRIPDFQKAYLSNRGSFIYHTLSKLGAIDVNGQLSETLFKQDIPHFDPKKERIYSLPLGYDAYTGNFWLMHAGGLSYFHPDKGLLLNFDRQNTKKLPHLIYSIFVDLQGIAWLSSIDGLYKVSLNPIRFKTLLNSDQAKNEPILPTRGIVEDGLRQTLYVNAGKSILALKNGSVEQIHQSQMDFFGIGMDDQKRVWTGDSKLHVYDPGTKNVQTFFTNRDLCVIWSIFSQKKGLWLGCSNGLAFFDFEQKKINFVQNKKGQSILDNAIIHSIKQAAGGQLWLLTEQGLLRFDPQKGVVARYWTGGKGQYFLPADNLRQYHQDAEGNWWIATADGLLKWNPERNTKRLFTEEDGLSNHNIYSVYADPYGFLWLSSDRGIVQFQKRSGRTRIFLPQDGLSHHEFNRVSHHQAKDGTIYFGSLNGITIFNPRDFHQDFDRSPNIPLMLTQAQLFSQKTKNLEDVEPEYLQHKKIIFEPSDLYLTLHFALLDYHSPDQTFYEYKIDRLGDRWASCPGGILQLAGLPYGQFKLTIRAKTEKGVYSQQQLVIPIQVLRPFYFRVWFLFATGFLIMAAIVTFFRYRNQWLQRRKIELEKEVAIQTEKILQDKAIIEEQATALIKLDAAKSRFFANVTHELRTPITLILGPIQTYLEQNQLSPQDAGLLYLAKNHTEGLQQMVNDLLDLSQLEAGKLTTHEAPVLLQQKIHFLLAPFEVVATNKGIELTLNYQADPTLVIQLDQRLFKMILNNLLSNALKFTESGGHIRVWVKDLASSVQLEVEDSGRGIHPDDLPFVFDRYFQTQHQENAYEGGTGIGLALARESSKAMGGTLEVNSVWGKGSTFILRFPKKELSDGTVVPESLETHNSPIPIEKPSATTIRSTGKAQLLLVEDNADLRQYLTQILSLDYQITALSNGREACEYLNNNTPDLIISDIMMPVMDGFQLLEWLKEGALAQIPVIMLTARADLGDKLRALRIGVDDYLVKPFVEIELLTRIQNLLQRQDLRRSLAHPREDQTLLTTSTVEPIKTEEPLSAAEKQWLELLEKTVLAQLDNLDFSVNDLAKAVFMSRSVFYNEMGRVLGLTPNEYINEVRLIKAMELFQADPGGYSVKEMASKVGYRDEKYFSRQFKQRFGVLPSHFRSRA